METSAKSGDKVEDAFVDTARRIHQNILDGRLLFIFIIYFDKQTIS